MRRLRFPKDVAAIYFKGIDGGIEQGDYVSYEFSVALAALGGFHAASSGGRADVPACGPGTELKKLLKTWLGIEATPTCKCNARARKMDEMEACEPGWCEAHLDEIVGWLREEATKRKLPFLDAAGRLLVRRAIANARRAASG